MCDYAISVQRVPIGAMILASWRHLRTFLCANSHISDSKMVAKITFSFDFNSTVCFDFLAVPARGLVADFLQANCSIRAKLVTSSRKAVHFVVPGWLQ